MQTDTATRDRLLAKIRALLAKTTEAGCTEAEALAAATLARDLMDRYAIDHGDLSEAEDPWHTEYSPAAGAEQKRRGKPNSGKRFRFKHTIYGRVGAFCDCYGIRNRDKDTIRYHGRQSDVMFATWLLDALDKFAARAWAAHDAASAIFADRALSREDFLFALGNRICERLREAIDARRATSAATGTALAVASKALVAKQHALTVWPNLRIVRDNYRAQDVAAVRAGTTAGDRATFARPMHGGGKAPLLLR